MSSTDGVGPASTPYVAFADDDSWWAPGALQGAADLFGVRPRMGLLAARILVGSEIVLDPVCHQMGRSVLGRAADLPGPSLLGFLACAAMVRREAFCAVGGFEEVVRFPGKKNGSHSTLPRRDGVWPISTLHQLRSGPSGRSGAGRPAPPAGRAPSKTVHQ